MEPPAGVLSGKNRQQHLDQLLAVRGKVVGTDPVLPFAEVAAFQCTHDNCGAITYAEQPMEVWSHRTPARSASGRDKNPSNNFSGTPMYSSFLNFSITRMQPGEEITFTIKNKIEMAGEGWDSNGIEHTIVAPDEDPADDSGG
ncbi:hypothetical protein [Halorussus pelagicus]|uniref:hypothetical protein n=1 Tax=Halorussus pelagicus TaxID=2505977 RepID=UPI000FFB4416|nr:hypothetical protein [Halorussus pelagicus]